MNLQADNPFRSPQIVDEPPGADIPLPEDPRPTVPGSVVLAWWMSIMFAMLVLAAAWGVMGAWAGLVSALGLGVGFLLLLPRPAVWRIGVAFYGAQLLLLGGLGLAGALRGWGVALWVLFPLAASAAILLLLMNEASVGYYRRKE